MGSSGRKIIGRVRENENWPAYYNFMNKQLTELLTNYGEIGAIWFDGKWDRYKDSIPFDWQLDEQYALIHKLQPSCLIGNNHHATINPGEDIQIFERDIPGENSPENVQVIIDEATRLSLLVNDLLDISRLQAGTEKIKCEEYNLTRSIRDIISRFDKLKENDGYNITFETDGDITVNADEARIAQAVYNLIGNAINYTGEDKSVRVVQKIYDGKVRIEITDSGEGIAKEELPYIWDRYYKVDKTHKRAEAGTGLGLSIVKTVFESHGAVYGVDSTVGEGSTFWFELDTE
jgi:signal transduction histidine kinase